MAKRNKTASLPLVEPDAAGIDIGATQVFVAVDQWEAFTGKGGLPLAIPVTPSTCLHLASAAFQWRP